LGGADYDGREKKGETEENKIAIDFLGGLIQAAKQKDPSRLATFVGISGGPSDWLGVCDIICINRYYGWYTDIGQMDDAMKILADELDKLYNKFNKPVIMTEFGADCLAGAHDEDGIMFTEEFQSDFIESYLNVANTKDYVAGMMIWNFADFRTGQAMFRVNGTNMKGVFTRDRKPKMAAHTLRKRWITESTNNY
jgi:beta-glucuronidase